MTLNFACSFPFNVFSLTIMFGWCSNLTHPRLYLFIKLVFCTHVCVLTLNLKFTQFSFVGKGTRVGAEEQLGG